MSFDIFENDELSESFFPRSDFTIHRQKITNIAYREGLFEGKNDVIQLAFDSGFSWALNKILLHGYDESRINSFLENDSFENIESFIYSEIDKSSL